MLSATYKRREKKFKEKKKMFLPLAIGENYIKKIFLFLIFYLWVFLLIANHKESETISHRKRR